MTKSSPPLPPLCLTPPTRLGGRWTASRGEMSERFSPADGHTVRAAAYHLGLTEAELRAAVAEALASPRASAG